MSHQFKLAASLLATLSLTACLEVEDSNNDAVVAALEAQNKLLEEQNKANLAPVTLSANIIAATDGVNLSDAQASIKFAGDWLPAVDLSEAQLLLENLPANSDFLLRIESPTNSFVSMTYSSMTTMAGVGQKVNQDLGDIIVGAPKEKQLTLLNSSDNSFVGNVKVYPIYNSNPTNGYLSAYDLQLVQPDTFATYNETTGTYSLVLAEGLPLELHAELDLDNDGVRDFEPELSPAASRLLTESKVWAESSLYLTEINEAHKYQFGITLLDNNGTLLTSARISTDGNDNGSTFFSFNEATEQYTLDMDYRGDIDVNIPSFIVGEDSYSSAYIEVTPSIFAGQYNVSISSNNSQYFTTELVDGRLNIAVSLYRYNYQSPGVSVLSSVLRGANYSVFYSAPVELVTDGDTQSSVTLMQLDSVEVIAGNESDTDSIAPGTTYIRQVNTSQDVTTELMLNGTKLMISPSSSLVDGEYSYQVENIVNKLSNEQENPHGDSESFVHSNKEFDIADISFDNQNFTTNGQLVFEQNTAAEPVDCSWCGNRGYTNLFLPTSVNQLEQFEITFTKSVNDGVESEENRTLEIISNGNNYYNSKVYVAAVAANENVDSYVYYANGTSKTTHAYYYKRSLYDFYLADDTDSSKNELTFNYSYTTKLGVSKNGTLTVPDRKSVV